ncbi:hypothetical protein CGH98_24230, partial [Vibrio parahaemolyticus]
MYDGIRIQADQTPEDLDMEDNDIIEAHREQIGGTSGGGGSGGGGSDDDDKAGSKKIILTIGCPGSGKSTWA